MPHRTSALAVLCNVLAGIGQDALVKPEDVDLAHRDGNATIPSLRQLARLKTGAGSCNRFDQRICHQPLKYSAWSWAAAATDIATYYAYPRFTCSSICHVVTHKFGQNCCGDALARGCWNTVGYGVDVADAINLATRTVRNYHIRYAYMNNAVSETYLQRHLQFGPVALLVLWYCDSRKVSFCPPGHFITVMGCGPRGYYVHDVGIDRGRYHTVPFHKLITYVSPSNPKLSGRWTGTVYQPRMLPGSTRQGSVESALATALAFAPALTLAQALLVSVVTFFAAGIAFLVAYARRTRVNTMPAREIELA